MLVTQPFASPEEALVHYGKKGMRWGVRNEDQPAGRDSSGRVVAEKPAALSDKRQKRVDKFVNRSEVMNTRISELKAANAAIGANPRGAAWFKRNANTQSIRELEQAQKQALSDAQAAKQGKLSSAQKKAIIGGVAVGALIGGGILASQYAKGQQSGAFNSYALRGSAFLRGQKVPFKMNPDLAKPMNASDLLYKVAKPVNPGYSSMGGKMNCRRSTFAYELRRRGFDVHATTSAVGWGQSESGVINAVTTDGKDYFRALSMSQSVVNTGKSSVATGDRRINPVKKILLSGLEKTPKDIETEILKRASKGKVGADMVGTASSSKKVLAELSKQPNGARGEVVFKFPGFGHSMAYEIVDGVPHIFDSQKGTLYNAATKMVESKWDGFTGAEIMRLDNVDLDINFLTRWATNN